MAKQQKSNLTIKKADHGVGSTIKYKAAPASVDTMNHTTIHIVELISLNPEQSPTSINVTSTGKRIDCASTVSLRAQIRSAGNSG